MDEEINTTFPPTVFDRKCVEVAKRLNISVEQVVAVFDSYEEISIEWAKLSGSHRRNYASEH